MPLRVTFLSSIVVICSLPVLAQNSPYSVSLFISGVRIDNTAEQLSVQPSREFHSWEGAFGIGLERRLSPRTTVELTSESRRDVVSAVLASRCNRNTCFETHRFEIRSTPVVLLLRFAAPAGNRLALFGSVGARYVSQPSAQDLSRATLYSFPARERFSPEAGAGIAWRATQRLSLFAEGRTLTHGAAQWDPRRRLNFGTSLRF